MSNALGVPSDDLYEIVIIRYGTREATRGEVFLNYDIYGRDDSPLGMDYYVWIIRNHARTILLDTGFSPEGGRRRSRTSLIQLADAYRAAGVDLEAEGDLIVSHAHYDHIGNLDLFPRVTVHISRREYDFWTSPMALRTQFAHSAERDEIDALQRANIEGRVRFVADDAAIAPGVEVREAGGHTPGQLITVVDTSEGRVVLASDAAHYYDELDEDLPFRFVADLPAMYRGFDMIHALVADGAKIVVPGHDPDTLRRHSLVRSGPLAGLAATIGGSAQQKEDA